MDWVATRVLALARKSAKGMEPWSPLPRVRTLTALAASSLSPKTRMYGSLLVGEVADFGVHFFVAVVGFDPEAGGFEFGFELFGVGEMLFADGDEANLHGREPEREGTGIVLDEDAEESLERAEERAVDHDGLMTLAVFADVFELETRGEIEVELHGGELPEAAEDVDEFDVDFGAVEGGFAGDGFVGDAFRLEHGVERANGQVPIFVGAGVMGAVVGIPGGELDLEFIEAEGVEHDLGKVDAGGDLALDLRRHAEDVGIVLSKAADAKQAVHGAGALIAVDVAELGVALRAGRDSSWASFCR